MSSFGRVARRSLVVVVAAVAVAGCGGGDDLGGEPMAEDPAVIVPAAAEAMGQVQTVRFELIPAGAPVYIDPAESLAVNEVTGRFAAPASADAVITITINDNLSTKLGAVAIEGFTWLSNPITGDFEELPASYEIDPAQFFDPQNWRDMLGSLRDPTFVGADDRDGTRYHLRAVAPADAMASVTAGLVESDDTEVDVWVHPVTGHVTALEFTAVHGGGTTDWVLELGDFGEDVVIEPPVDG